MMIESDSLPPTWTNVRLEDISEIILGQSPPGSSYNTDENGTPFFQGSAEFGDLYPEVRKWTTKPTKLAKAGDVLLSVRAPVGPTNLAPLDCAIGRGVAAIRAADGIEPKYLLYGLRATESTLSSKGTGTTFAAVAGAAIREHSIPLAPTAEQRRIVTAIEEYFSRIDSAVSALQSCEVMLRRYRAVILDTVCFGSGIQAVATLEGEQRSLSSGGRWTNVGSAIQIIDYRGRTPPLAKEGIPHVRTVNIRGGKLLWNNLAYVSPETYSAYMTRGLPRSGDLLFTTEAPLGEVTQAPDDRKFSVAQRVMILRPNNEIWFSPFLMYQLMSPRFQQILRRTGTGTTVTGVSSRNFRTLPLYAPPLPQQKSAVAALDETLSLIENLQQSIGSAKARARRLRSSILQQAFRGCLIPSDSSDEPAAILLHRVKATRVSDGSNPQRRLPR